MAGLLQFVTALSCVVIAVLLMAADGTFGAPSASAETPSSAFELEPHHDALRAAPLVLLPVVGKLGTKLLIQKMIRAAARAAKYELKQQFKDVVKAQIKKLFDRQPTLAETSVEFAQYAGVKKYTSAWAYTLSGDLGVDFAADDPVQVCANACQFTSWCSAFQISVDLDACELIDSAIDADGDVIDDASWVYVVSCEEYDCNA